MSQDLEFNKEGFKMSYQRYLSDGITGLMFISFFIVAFIKKWELPIVRDTWLTLFPNEVNTEIRIASLIFLFLIAPSIGLTLNALSWFLLGAPSIWLIWLWDTLPKKRWAFLMRYFIEGTNRSFHAENLFRFFNIEGSAPVIKNQTEETTDEIETNENQVRKDVPERLYDVANYFEHLLTFYFPSYFASQMDYVQGLRRFLRTTALLSVLLSIYFATVHYNLSSMLLSLLFAAFFLIFTSINEYFQALKMLFMVYTLVMDKFMENSPQNRKEIARVLAETGVKSEKV